jgi:hypothetical protein
LVGLVIDQNEDRILGAEKRCKAITKGHEEILWCRCE